MASLSLSSAPSTSCSEKTLPKNCPSGVIQNAGGVLVSNELMMIVCEKDGKPHLSLEKNKETSEAPSLFSYLTMDELLFNLKSYILKHQLYDPLDPRKILLHGNELGSLLGLSEFSLLDVRGILLNKFVFPVARNSEVSSEVICSISEKCVSKKRKLENVCDSEFSAKKFFNGDSSDDKESMHSLQDYETEWVKDSTSDDNYSVNGLIIAETFDVDVEYEIQTDSEYSYESDSDLENFVKSAIISFIAETTDSDIEYLADESSDNNESEKELFEEDKWQCFSCGYRNDSPYVRKCASCWQTRNGWLCEREKSKTKQKESGARKKKQKKSNKNKDSSKKDCKLPSDFPSTTKTESLNSTSSPCNDSSDVIRSQSSTNTLEVDKNTQLCIFCCARPADCSILHGNSACKICCFKCGDKLKGSTHTQKSRARCPNCRRIIERIVFLYNL